MWVKIVVGCHLYSERLQPVFFSLLKHHDFQIHREWQTMEILECKAGVKGRTLHVTNKNANEQGQEIFLIVIKFVTCEVR